MDKKVLATWLVHEHDNFCTPHCLMKTAFGTIRKEKIADGEIEVIDFGGDGYWQISDFKFIRPENVGDIPDYMTDDQAFVDFANENGVYVMFMKVTHPKGYKFVLE